MKHLKHSIESFCQLEWLIFLNIKIICSTLVTEPAAFIASISSQNITCNGLADGIATVTESGGTAPYSYQWNTGSSIDTISNLSPGTYDVIVTDDNGCNANDTVTITEPALLVAVVSGNNITCNGLNNGMASVAPVGGTAPYTYFWNIGATTDSITNLSAGTYSVIITDANGCTASDSVAISEPAILVASAFSSNVTCNGLNNGTAGVLPSGGTAPYT